MISKIEIKLLLLLLVNYTSKKDIEIIQKSLLEKY